MKKHTESKVLKIEILGNKIVLKPGKPREFHKFRYHDEGHEYTHIQVSINDGYYYFTREHGGQDCDGGHSYYDEFSQKVENGKLVGKRFDGKHSVYDQYAELMGY